jgi:CHAT domain-containing protein/tetratricopeptide (TPR) repeat protein
MIASTLGRLGKRLSAAGDHAKAKVCLEEAVFLTRQHEGKGVFSLLNRMYLVTSLLSLSQVHSKLGEKSASLRCLEEAAAVQQQMPNEGTLGWALSTVVANSQAGFDYEHGQKERAIRVFEQLLRGVSGYFERNALAQSEREQLNVTADFGWVAYSVMLGLLQLKEPERAYSILLQWKGAVTARQRWARLARNPDDARTAELMRELRAVDQQLLSFGMTNPASMRAVPGEAAMQALSARREKLERDLASYSAAYRREKQRSQRGPAEIIASLPPDTVLVDAIEFIDPDAFEKDKDASRKAARGALPRRLGAFVARPGTRVQWIDLGASAELAALVDRWRASYGAGKAPDPGQPDPGMELRKRVWVPLMPHLGGAKTVLISPDGPLNGLPWSALPGTQPGTLLVHEYAFAVVPVSQLLPELLHGNPRQDKEQPSLLLAGGIDFGQSKAQGAQARDGKLPPVPVFKPLPGAESEANDLRAQFEDNFPDAPAPKRLSKDKATKQAVLTAAPAHRFVHLATHGFFADESVESAVEVAQRADLLRGGLRLNVEATGRHPGLLSGLVFAGVNRTDRPPEEAILTALEAAELNLDKVELVVLSACETGRGRVAGGEGVLGLQRAFQLAGAHSVVASLWKVRDEETHQLMREFYRRVWSKDPVSKAEALRQAQLWMLENWKPRGTLERPAPQGPPSPYYWAAFVLSGDWR